MSQYAPIALIAFRRPRHLRRALESLAQNPEFPNTELHVFCDGPRDEGDIEGVEAVREVMRRWLHPKLTVYEAPSNQGLAETLVNAVTRLCESHQRVIVVEDDLVVSPRFLAYMNEALRAYEDEPQVMQISGHMFPVDLENTDFDGLFLPFTTSWGWATWLRAWRSLQGLQAGARAVSGDYRLRRRFDLGGSYPYSAMLKQRLRGEIDSWAIEWYLAVFMNNGLVLYPTQTLVNNAGFDGSGTNCGVGSDSNASTDFDSQRNSWKLPPVGLSEFGFGVVTTYLKGQNTLWMRAIRKIRSRMARVFQNE